MRFREVLLVIFLVLAGFVLYQAKTGHWNLDWTWGWDEDFGFFGREYATEETRTIDAPLPPLLEVVNGQGWVEVRGGDGPGIQLTFKKVVWRRKEEEARDVAARIQCKIEAASDRLTLSTNRDEFRRRSFETGFILTVPRSMAVRVTNAYGLVRVESVKEATVRNRHGEVYAADIEGPAAVETSYEDVEVQNIRGECRITSRNSDVRAGAVKGDLWVETSYGRAEVEDAGGKVEIRGSNVKVDARRVQGAVAVDTSYESVFLLDVGPATVTARNTAVTAEKVRGDLDIRTSYDSVEATDVQGRFLVDANNAAVSARGVGGSEIFVKTSYDNVSLAGFSAAVTVVMRNGRVTLEPLDLKHGMDVRNQYGTVNLAWPEGERARLEARAKGGSITWGLAGRPDVDQTNGESVVKAYTESGEAPLIFLSTTYDDIRIEPAGRRF